MTPDLDSYTIFKHFLMGGDEILYLNTASVKIQNDEIFSIEINDTIKEYKTLFQLSELNNDLISLSKLELFIDGIKVGDVSEVSIQYAKVRNKSAYELFIGSDQETSIKMGIDKIDFICSNILTTNINSGSDNVYIANIDHQKIRIKIINVVSKNDALEIQAEIS